MEIRVLKNEGKELVLEFETFDATIPELLAKTMLKDKDVEFAGVSEDHIETIGRRLTLKTGRKKPKDVLEKAVGELEEEISSIKSSLK
jgi:DNA-directed RNA polymerase subunit L